MGTVPHSGPLTISVPEAGALLGLGLQRAYRSAANGEIPAVRMGHKVVVPIHKLAEMLGCSVEDLWAQLANGNGR